MHAVNVSGGAPYHNFGLLLQEVQIRKIKDVKDRGLFAVHQHSLSKSSDLWSQSNWWDRIQKIVEGNCNDRSVSPTEILLCYVFAVAIDPEVSDEDKEQVINQACQSLEAREKENFHFSLGKELPPAMSTTILRYSSRELWEGSCGEILPFYSVFSCEECFANWILGVLSSDWSEEIKKDFLSRMFDVLPESSGEEVFYFFMVSHENLEEKLYEICSPLLRNKIDRLKEEVQEFGQNNLNQSASEQTVPYIPYDDYKRRYFLSWFCKNALEQPNACLIAGAFREKDWSWLQSRFAEISSFEQRHFARYCSIYRQPSRLAGYAFKWMIDIAKRMNQGVLSGDNRECSIWLFFSKSSSFIDGETDWSQFKDEDFREFGEALSVPSLQSYMDAFKGKLIEKVVMHLVSREPRKFIDLIRYYQKIPEKNLRNGLSETIYNLFSLLDECGCLNQGIRLMHQKSDEQLFLTVYSTLSTDMRKAVINFNLEQGEDDCVRRLCTWISICLLKDNRKKLKPFVRDGFSKDLYVILKEVDSSLPEKLMRRLSEMPEFQSSEEFRSAVQLVLPIDLNFEDPIQRQNIAIQKLKKSFMDPGVSHNDKKALARSLRKDIEGGEGDSVWVPKLFDQLPEKTWPLIFLYYDYCVLRGFSGDSIGEEQKVDIAVRALKQMLDNPCVDECQHQVGWSLQYFDHVIRGTIGLELVIRKFIERCLPEDFIPVMNELAHSAYYNSVDDFHKLVSESLESANVEKIPFIAKCLRASCWEGFRDIRSLQVKFFKEPFLKSHEERAELVKILIRDMGKGFLPCLINLHTVSSMMIESLKEVDEEYAGTMFLQWVGYLNNYSTKGSFSRFRALMNIYSDAGFDVLNMLNSAHNRGDRRVLNVKSCYRKYASTVYADEYIRLLDLKLLRRYNQQGFYSDVSKLLMAMFTDGQHIAFFKVNDLLQNLEQLACKEEFIEYLFEVEQGNVETIREALKENLVEAFTSYNAHQLIPLLCRLVPEWKEPMAESTKEIIKEEAEWSLRTGSKVKYKKVVELFKPLQKVGKLDDFVAFLKVGASERFLRELAQVEDIVRTIL